MTKVKAFFKWLGNIIDDVLAYVLTLLCVMFASIVPLLNSGQTLVIDTGLYRIVGSALVALLLTFWQEYNKPDETGSKVRSKEGKKKNFLKRMIYSMLFGFASPMIMEKLLTLVNVGV